MMPRIARALALIVVSVGAAACQVDVEGNGVPAQQQRITAPFSAIETHDTFTAHVAAGQDFSVIVIGDDNLVPFIDTKVYGNTLVVDADVSYSTGMEVGVLVTVPWIDSVVATEASRIEADGIFDGFFYVEASGASSVRVSGSSVDADVVATDAASVDARDLVNQRVFLDLSGAADAEVYAWESVSGYVSDSASATIYGRPYVIDALVTDAGSIAVQ